MLRWISLAVIFLIAIAIALGLYSYRYVTEIRTTLTEPIEVLIKSGDSMSSVAERLHQAGVIENPRAFEWLARYKEQDNKLQAGEYRFEGNIVLTEVLEKLVKGSVITYELQLAEGQRLESYLSMLRANEALVNDLEGVTPDNVLEKLEIRFPAIHGEGLFYPETYQFRRGEAASTILVRAFDLMHHELNMAWMSASEDIHVDSKYELLVVASMVERESHNSGDRRRIAGVIHRRLGLGMRLQIDPTVIYALGAEFEGRLLRRHLRLDHPHNTYRIKGLPPTPICSTSREALRAASNPAPGKELYFVSRGDGSSQFSETLAEHNEAVARYINNRELSKPSEVIPKETGI